MFALVWGAMGLALVKWVHPLVQELVRDIPAPVSLWAVLAALADLAVSSWMMRATGGRECLQWYRFLRPDGA